MKTNKIALFLFLIIIMFVSGCNDGIVYLNATSTGDCLIQCKNLTSNFNYHCMNAQSNYGTIIENNKLISNSCECILLDCFREIE